MDDQDPNAGWIAKGVFTAVELNRINQTSLQHICKVTYPPTFGVNFRHSEKGLVYRLTCVSCRAQFTIEP